MKQGRDLDRISTSRRGRAISHDGIRVDRLWLDCDGADSRDSAELPGREPAEAFSSRCVLQANDNVQCTTAIDLPKPEEGAQ